ncbi:endolysin endopeptidase [Streptomyces phage Shaeky]|uniref:Endolysin endopeptidase n=1 Tax=Streptomyces phage Shaeky TaxID=2767586 RepID=A0A873WJN2_9CAUD|nr:endolysin endopeptidase [Streptomyces phage Shaeky]
MTQVSRLIAIANKEVGYHEGFSDGHWNNIQKYSPAVPGLEWSQGMAWCQTFQSWLFQTAGLKALAPVSASCWYSVDWFRDRGRFSWYPAVGAQVFFGANGASHVGLVVKYDADYVWTVEGNTNGNGSAEGDGVYAKKRARRDSYLYGYGLPAYAEGSVSADPDAAKYGYRRKATGSVADVGDPAPTYEPFPGTAWFKSEPRSAIVTAMGKRLEAMGYKGYAVGPGPQWTDADKAAYAWWQRKLGYSGADADGWPGKTSWDKLRVPNV